MSRAADLVTLASEQLEEAPGGVNAKDAWQMVLLGMLSALVWMAGMYWLPSLLWTLLPVCLFAWLYGRRSDRTLAGWLWRASLLSLANLATQYIVLIEWRLDEPYVQRLLADAPPDAPGVIALFALFFSFFIGSGAPFFGALIGYLMVASRRRRV